MEDAKKKPRPFDRVLVDDTSRLARNLVDGLRLVEVLRYHGVFVTAVSQGIDFEQKSARQLLTLHGMMDEQFLVELANKVHRGQEGRVLKELHPGGRCYGYVNVPIEDLNRQAKYGHAAVLGVRLAINPQEAEVVRRIFQMYADGLGLGEIAKTLNREGVPSPQGPRSRLIRGWCPSSIREMLRNERYRGVQVWNRTEEQRNPETEPDSTCLCVMSHPSKKFRELDTQQRREEVVKTVQDVLQKLGNKKQVKIRFVSGARVQHQQLRETAADRWDLSGGAGKESFPEEWFTAAELLEMRQGVTPGGCLDALT